MKAFFKLSDRPLKLRRDEDILNALWGLSSASFGRALLLLRRIRHPQNRMSLRYQTKEYTLPW